MGIFDKLRGGRRNFRATLEPLGVTIDVPPDATLLQAALAAGLPLAHSCRVGSCASCKCRVLDGTVKELTDSSYVLSMADIEAGYVLACQSRARSDLRVFVNTQASIEAGVPLREIAGKILSQRTLTAEIQELRVRLARPLEYRAGQYVNLSAEGFDRPRPYSLAAAPSPGGSEELVFFVRHVPGGRFTDWLFSGERSGSVLRVSSALGGCTLRPGAGPVLFVAGGSGLAPILALLEEAALGPPRDALLLFGARAQVDLFALERLEEIRGRWPGELRIVSVLSREAAAGPWRGGRITDHISAETRALDLANADAYVCGSPPVVDAVRAALIDLHMNSSQIHCDRFADARHFANFPDPVEKSA